MNKSDYKKFKIEIINKYGKPEFDMNRAANESAERLTELKKQYLREIEDVKKTKTLIKDIDKLLVVEDDAGAVLIPEEIIKDSWLTPFIQDEKLIINQWLTNTRQNTTQISKALKIEKEDVKKLLASEAFKLLRSNVALAYKALLPIEAVATLRRCLASKNESTALNAVKLIVEDAGLYKSADIAVNLSTPKAVKLDPETEERLRQLGNQIMNNKKETDNNETLL